MKRRVLLTSLIAAAAVCCLAVPAAAETFTSSDGVFSIELPADDWKEMNDPASWVALSDGSNVITVDHYSNGEKLPEIKVADDHYVNVYEAAFSTQNEVFIITGYVVDADEIPEIANSIITAKVLKYDTKMKVNAASQQQTSSDYTIAALDKTMYVTTDSLNIRSGCSTNDQIVGSLVYGDSVHVTGSVQQGGKDFGWYQIQFNNGTGYVSASYLSDSAPAEKSDAKKAANGITFTGTATTVYAMSGTAVTIYKASDGNWYDANGTLFTWITSDKLSNAGGDSFTTNKPADSSSGITPVESFTAYWLNGNGETLTKYSDGSYYSDSWVQYYDAGGGAFAGADGSTLYSTMPEVGTAGGSLVHGLESQGSRRPVEITSDDGDVYYDQSGTTYYQLDDGTYVDSNGDVFDVVW